MPQAVSAISNKRAYTYIGAFSAALYAVVLVAPVIASMLAEEYQLNSFHVGMVNSVELGCFSIATVPAYLWLQRANVRWVTLFCTCVVVLGNVASAIVPTFEGLVVLRAVTALAAGSITVLILSLSAKTSNPSRAYGIFLVAQLGMGAVILLVFPVLYSDNSLGAVYLTLAGLAALCIPAAWCLRGGEFTSAGTVREKTRMGRRTVAEFASGLLAVLCFYLALGGVWTFMAEIAQHGGVSVSLASSMLGIATLVGAAVALLATLVGESRKENFYILAGYLAMGTAMALLFGAPGLLRYIIAIVTFKIAWSWLLPFLLSVVSRTGGSHVMSSTNLMIGTGLGVGPLLAGQLIDASGGFGLMITVSLVVLAVAVSASCWVMRSRPNEELAGPRNSAKSLTNA